MSTEYTDPEFEVWEQEFWRHQPVLSMHDGHIAGCSCLDRVFYNEREDWGTHLANVMVELLAKHDAEQAAVVRRTALLEAAKPVLISMPLARIVAFWRPGSHEWSWAEEYADLMPSDVTQAVLGRVDSEGIDFADEFAPVLLGNDGRVWDGHHRICIAIQRAIPSLMVEMIASGTISGSADATDAATCGLGKEKK